MPLVPTVPYSWQFWPPPYGPLRSVTGNRPMLVLDRGRRLPPPQRWVEGLGWVNFAVQGGIMAVTAAIGFFKRSAERRNAATAIVNEAAELLNQNLAAYQASAHTKSDQAAALANYESVWQAVKDACLVPELGQAGRRCVSDRERDGATPWPVYYRDPIANDPNVQDDPPLTATGNGAGVDALLGNGVTVGAGLPALDWRLLAGAGLLIAALAWKG